MCDDLQTEWLNHQLGGDRGLSAGVQTHKSLVKGNSVMSEHLFTHPGGLTPTDPG